MGYAVKITPPEHGVIQEDGGCGVFAGVVHGFRFAVVRTHLIIMRACENGRKITVYLAYCKENQRFSATNNEIVTKNANWELSKGAVFFVLAIIYNLRPQPNKTENERLTGFTFLSGGRPGNRCAEYLFGGNKVYNKSLPPPQKNIDTADFVPHRNTKTIKTPRRGGAYRH